MEDDDDDGNESLYKWKCYRLRNTPQKVSWVLRCWKAWGLLVSFAWIPLHSWIIEIYLARGIHTLRIYPHLNVIAYCSNSLSFWIALTSAKADGQSSLIKLGMGKWRVKNNNYNNNDNNTFTLTVALWIKLFCILIKFMFLLLFSKKLWLNLIIDWFWWKWSLGR